MCHLRLMMMLGTEPELCAHWTSRQLTYELPSFLPLRQPYYVALAGPEFESALLQARELGLQGYTVTPVTSCFDIRV